MKLNEREMSDGRTWFLWAGLTAMVFSFCLFRVDEYLSRGKERDFAHAQMMRELRLAQASLPSRVTDSRQLLPLTIEGSEHSHSNGADK